MNLLLVKESEKEALTNLVNEYLKVHCSHQEVSVGPETVDDYIYYPEYWREKGRYPYFIEYESEVVGFVLVRTVFEENSHFYQVSDFYIKPQYEGLGYGTKAASKLFFMYPVEWELDTQARNERARSFWGRCIEKFGNGNHKITEHKYEDGLRYQHNFEVTES